MVRTKAISDINAYQTYIDALDNPYTRKNYEIHFSGFEKALKASETCNEMLEIDDRVLEDRIVEHLKEMTKRGASTASMRLALRPSESSL